MRASAALTSLAVLLGGCGGIGGGNAQAPSLEAAAIQRGLIADPGNSDFVGLYARDADRLCIVPQGGDNRVGVTADFGGGVACSGGGTVQRVGERLRFELEVSDCQFEARFDGARITFPARLPGGCKALCTGRASLAAMDVSRLSESLSEAAAMRDARGRLPCRT